MMHLIERNGENHRICREADNNHINNIIIILITARVGDFIFD